MHFKRKSVIVFKKYVIIQYVLTGQKYNDMSVICAGTSGNRNGYHFRIFMEEIMAGQTNLQKDVLVLNMEHQLLEIAQNMFDKEIAELTDQELYYVVLVLTKRLMKVSDENEGERRCSISPQSFS